MIIGVTIHEDCTLARWHDGEKDTAFRCATFTSSTKPVKVESQVCLSVNITYLVLFDF